VFDFSGSQVPVDWRQRNLPGCRGVSQALAGIMRQTRSAASAYVGKIAASTAQTSTARLISYSVLVGDPRQLQSIEAGAAFRSIHERHGGAEIGGVRRQREDWQRDATRDPKGFRAPRTMTILLLDLPPPWRDARF
jgi:hypothetical protein